MAYLLAAIAYFVIFGAVTMSAHADATTDRAAIIERLQRWTASFNARDTNGVCDLFAPDLVAIVPGSIDRTRDGLCSKLDALLALPEPQLHYDNPEIEEIIVSGDIAVVRPIWTLRARKGSEQDLSTETGIDIFKRQQDGKWSIVSFAAFTHQPNKNLH